MIQTREEHSSPDKAVAAESLIETGRNLQPSSLRLLQGLRATLGGILQISEGLDDRTRLSLQTCDIVLNELQLRENRSFMSDLFANLRSLAEEGAARIGGKSRSGATDLASVPLSVSNSAAFDVTGPAIESVLQVLAAQVDQLRRDERPETRQFVSRAIDEETRIFTYRSKQASVPAAATGSSFTRAAFEAYLSRRFPEQQYKILSFRELVEGFQKTTILCVIRDARDDAQGIVIRAEKPDVFLTLDAGKVKEEFDIVTLLHRRGIPVAEPLWLETDPAELGYRFMVSRQVAGTNPGNPLAPETLDDETAREVVRVLAQIHAVRPDKRLQESCVAPWFGYSSLRENTLASVQSWKDQMWMPYCNASIATIRLYNWLVDNAPEENAPPRLLHVDYGPHNMLVEGGKVTGVLDWESVRFGDPAEDLSDLLGRFQGKIDRSKAIAWYREAGGDEISEYRLRYFDAFNNIKMLVGPMSAAAMFEYEEQTPLRWLVLPLLYGSVSRAVEDKIAAAETVGQADT